MQPHQAQRTHDGPRPLQRSADRGAGQSLGLKIMGGKLKPPPGHLFLLDHLRQAGNVGWMFDRRPSKHDQALLLKHAMREGTLLPCFTPRFGEAQVKDTKDAGSKPSPARVRRRVARHVPPRS